MRSQNVVNKMYNFKNPTTVKLQPYVFLTEEHVTNVMDKLKNSIYMLSSLNQTNLTTFTDEIFICSMPVNSKNSEIIYWNLNKKYIGKKISTIISPKDLPLLSSDLNRQLADHYTTLIELNKKYPSSTMFTHLSIDTFNNTLFLYLNVYKLQTNWVLFKSPIFLNVNELQRSTYENLIKNIQEGIQYFNTNTQDNVFQYGLNFNELKCVYSTDPSLHDKYCSECFLPGIVENYPDTLSNINQELMKYKSLSDIALVQYKIGSKHFIGVVKIKNNTYVYKQILLNPYIQPTTIDGDTRLYGSLSVRGNKYPVMEMNVANKITSFYDKVGINQRPVDVHGLLDINNTTQEMIVNINKLIKKMMEESYSYINAFDETNPVNDNYATISIQNENITFYNQDVLSALNYESMVKIKNLALDVTTDYIYTFTELLNDTKNNYLCIIKGKLINDKVYFVIHYTNVNSIVYNSSYCNYFISIIKKYSTLNKNLNYGSLLLTSENVDLIKTHDLTNFTGMFKIKPDEYFFCFELTDNLDETTYLFHELYTKWNGQSVKSLFIHDIKVLDIIKMIVYEYKISYQNNYGQSFLMDYSWTNGMKVSFSNVINVDDKLYWLGTGIDLVNYVVPSIKSKGDCLINGNIVVQDDANNIAFSVNNYTKNITNMYKVGIGNLYPESTLDIKDSGISDILNLTQDITISDEFTNKIIHQLKNSTDMTTSNINSIIQNIYPNESTNNYYVVAEFKDGYQIADITYRYFYHFYNYLDKNLETLRSEPLIDQQIVDVMESTFTRLVNSYSGDNLMSPLIIDFIWGKKGIGAFYFKNIHNNTLYVLYAGKNLQTYNFRIFTNNNINTYFNVLNSYQHYLQSILIRTMNITTRNNDVLNELLQNEFYLYKSPTVKYYSITETTNVSQINYDATIETGSLVLENTQSISDIEDVNIKHKETSFLYSLNKFYKLNEMDSGFYGMMSYEDDLSYYVAQFYLTKVDSTYNIIAVELCVNDYIKSAVNVQGDTTLKGDFMVCNKSTNIQYTTIDPNQKYVGVNTDNRVIQYENRIAKHHVYVTNNIHPNAVFERFCDTTYTTRSSATLKRKTDQTLSSVLDSIPESTIPFVYGSDLSFEVEDGSEVTKEIGNIHMGVGKDEKSGFGVSVYNFVEGTMNETSILHVNEDGLLHVNELKLGNDKIILNGHGALTTESFVPKGLYEVNNRDAVQTFYPFATSVSQSYKINLIETPQTDLLPEYVFTIKIACDYTECNLSGTTPITNDIYGVNSYYFNTHFIYDTSWTTKMLPPSPYSPACISCNSSGSSSTQFTITHDGSNKYIILTVTPSSNMYIVGTLNILFGDVYPSQKTLYRDFNFSISRV